MHLNYPPAATFTEKVGNQVIINKRDSLPTNEFIKYLLSI